MTGAELYSHYQNLQQYVGWTEDDARRLAFAEQFVRNDFTALVNDFYAEIQRHPRAAAVITGGPQQVARLKDTLRSWIEELFAGPFDEIYVHRRARVGLKHVEIGLEQVYTNVALARVRSGLLTALGRNWRGSPDELAATMLALNKLLDLDLAVITAVYEAEHVRREQAAIRVRLEGLLHQQREFSEGVILHAPAVVLVLDLQGRIVRMNPYVEQIAGLSSAEAEGQDWLALLVPEGDRPRARRALFESVLRDPLGRGSATTGLRADEHPRREIRWSSTLLKDAAGEPFALLVLGQDITDLNAAQERALRSERLAAIGQVAAGMAHEARNALQRIQACAEMLELEVEHQPQALDYVRRIEQAQSHMHRLFEEIRGYAAPILLDRSVCRLAALWREAWELLNAQRAGRDAVLHEASQPDQFEANVDRYRLVQVFRNVLENSLAACQDPVKIDILCSPAQLGTQAGVRISLHDNGPGMSAEQRTRLFEPFFTTKVKGTGLGMAIAQRLIEAHGGTIEVGASTPGAEIIITLPLELP